MFLCPQRAQSSKRLIESETFSPICIAIAVLYANPFQIEPYLPYEFTCEGMLQRVNILIEKQVGQMLVDSIEGGGLSFQKDKSFGHLVPSLLLCVSGLLLQHRELAPTERAPGGEGRGKRFL